MSSSTAMDVGFRNPNDLINVGLANIQPGPQDVFVMHCMKCHRNCATPRQVLLGRHCPNCGDGEQGLVLPEADQVRRCGETACLKVQNT